MSMEKEKSQLANIVKEVSRWTDERVKNELPDVKISGENGEIYIGHVQGQGRILPSAKVRFTVGGLDIAMDFSWDAIAYCLNANIPLRGYTVQSTAKYD